MTGNALDSNRGLLLVVSGPSGVGKTTIVHEIERRLRGRFSVSATTRAKSEHEVHGKDYLFVERDEFEAMSERGEFLESALVFGRDWYGTPRASVERQLARGQLVILDIDVQGALQVRSSMPTALMIFILPPSEDELERRLRERGRDDEDAIQRRFAEAKAEIRVAKESGAYDSMVVNDDLEGAIEEACGIIEARRSSAIT